ncbi:MAG: hypothetical protein RLY31_3249 [Bacteroidota bacterium]|jgi:NitT/TauT family transport system permease protein
MFDHKGILPPLLQKSLPFLGVMLLLISWWLLAEAFAVRVPKVEGYNRELPSSITGDSLENQRLRDSLLRADSVRLSLATEVEKVYPILPRPWTVLERLPHLIRQDRLAGNSLRSVWLTLQGYFWAVLLSVPLGFLIGLFPVLRGLFSKPVHALRYLPLTALIGVFIIWFGIYDEMKVAFLAFGIIVFLLPTVISRIEEVEKVYLQTVFTLGAGKWQTFRSVYFPAVMSRVLDDISVLTAVSWTYIIVAEYINKDSGGLGALLYVKRRLQQVPDMFAIILLIVLIGFLQDQTFRYLSKRLFPFRYVTQLNRGFQEVRMGIFLLLSLLALSALFPGVAGNGTLLLIGGLAAVLFMVYGEILLRSGRKPADEKRYPA